jgi:hypothetical protein
MGKNYAPPKKRQLRLKISHRWKKMNADEGIFAPAQRRKNNFHHGSVSPFACQRGRALSSPFIICYLWLK